MYLIYILISIQPEAGQFKASHFSSRKYITPFAYSFTDAKTDETLIMKIFNPNYRPSDDQLTAMLKKADLEGHGYKKEITTSLVSEPGSDKPLHRKKYLYYKIVDCSRVQEIVQELQILLPGKRLILLSE